jgi:hypothetical protein
VKYQSFKKPKEFYPNLQTREGTGGYKRLLEPGKIQDTTILFVPACYL